MKYLVIDTETSGLFSFKEPADAPGQPRLAQLGMIFLDDIDAEPREQGFHIQPNGWSMPPEASAVNGLTDEFLEANGVDVAVALAIYTEAIRAGYCVVAFNAQFDTKVMRAELRRAGRPDLFEQTANICVMRPLTGILKLPKRNGYGFKFPNLAEACGHCGIVNEKAHDAMGDARAALGVMRWLHANGLLPEPAVHFAKERA